jgi:signal transduction histidine kinase
VETALDIVDHQFTVNNITVTRGLAATLPSIRADANKMGQVLLNLLVNAADAVEPGAGEIFIGTDTKEVGGRPFVELKVADNGHGIPTADQSQIFEPFFTTKESGTGLGLAVVWGIVSEHAGTITVNSKPNRGTTFTVRIPTAASLESLQMDGDDG